LLRPEPRRRRSGGRRAFSGLSDHPPRGLIAFQRPDVPPRSSAVRSTRPATLWSDCPNRCTLRFGARCDKHGSWTTPTTAKSCSATSPSVSNRLVRSLRLDPGRRDPQRHAAGIAEGAATATRPRPPPPPDRAAAPGRRARAAPETTTALKQKALRPAVTHFPQPLARADPPGAAAPATPPAARARGRPQPPGLCKKVSISRSALLSATRPRDDSDRPAPPVTAPGAPAQGAGRRGASYGVAGNRRAAAKTSSYPFPSLSGRPN